MPSKTKLKNAAIAARSAALPKIPAQLLDQLVQGPMTAESILDVTTALKKALIERALGGELSHHLGYPPGGDKPAEAGNHRNGSTGKTVLTEDGPLRIELPRDRQGSFEPLLIPKHERRFTGFDDKIVAMYARGMTVREIQAFLAEQYATEVSPEFISSVTDAVMGEVTAWQARPLEAMYPVVFFDALRVKIREDAVVHSNTPRFTGALNAFRPIPASVHFPVFTESSTVQPAGSFCASVKLTLSDGSNFSVTSTLPLAIFGFTHSSALSLPVAADFNVFSSKSCTRPGVGSKRSSREIFRCSATSDRIAASVPTRRGS
jgi:hypothetical protein